MARRSTPQRSIDEAAFPVRIKVRVPPDGLGTMLNVANRWLNDELGPHNWAHWPTASWHGDAIAYHFRSLEAASRFLAAFPMFELADGVLISTGD